MNRILIIISAILLWSITATAQTITVSEMKETAADSLEFPLALDGEQSALVKIQFDAAGVRAEGNVLRQEHNDAGIHNVWVSPGTKMLRVKADGMYPLMIRFAEHGVRDILPAHAYILTLNDVSKIKEYEYDDNELEDTVTAPFISYDGNLSAIPSFSKTELNEMERKYKQATRLCFSKPKDGFVIYKSLADKGFVDAFKEVVHCYYHGVGIKEDKAMARRYAEAGVEKAPLHHKCETLGDNLGRFGYDDLVFRCYAKLAANDKGGWYRLGQCYEQGIGVQPDITKANEFYRYAVARDDHLYDAVTALIRNGVYICSQGALASQKYDFSGKSTDQIEEECTKLVFYSQKKPDMPRRFAIWKVLADHCENLYASMELTRAYDGRGGLPVKDADLADRYSAQARRLRIQRQGITLASQLNALAAKGGDNTFFSDYSRVRVGDYFYPDGTMSHAVNPAKTPSGIVFALGTTPEETAMGFSHGYIIALTDACDRYGQVTMDWADSDSLTTGRFIPSPKAALADMQGFTLSHDIPAGSGFTAADAAREYHAPLPDGKTTGWYLPAIGQLVTMIENLGDTKVRNNGHFKRTELVTRYPFFRNQSPGIFFGSATECDATHPWILSDDYLNKLNEKHDVTYYPMQSVRVNGMTVRPVAAF